MPAIMEAESGFPSPVVRSVDCIWDKAPHCAFTDLIEYKGTLLCVFRESDAHVYGKDGVVRILSQTGKWHSVALIARQGIDLRDPHLSVTPDNRLMLLVEGVTYVGQKCIKRAPYVAFSYDGENFSPLQEIDLANEWIWRVTWHKDVGYAASYHVPIENPRLEWKLSLVSTQDAVHYTFIKELAIPGHPSEATIRFLPDDTMILLVRHGDNGSIGSSKPPYDSFSWHKVDLCLGGPNFLIFPNGEMWAASRIEGEEDVETTALAKMSLESLAPVTTLMPYGYDSGYPGMVYKDGILYITFYWSKDENNISSIYLAEVVMPTH